MKTVSDKGIKKLTELIISCVPVELVEGIPMLGLSSHEHEIFK